MFYQYDPCGLIANASNVVTGTNPDYTIDDFLAFFPQFTGLVDNSFVLDQFIAMANTVVLEARWFEQWKFGMALFIAHWLTLYLQSANGGPDATAAQVIGAAQVRGLQTSKSVDSLSVSYDVNVLVQGIEGWGMWKSTSYGMQFITIARMLGKGGMYIW